ncbi:malectin domain-containing carbohydrate-binding protein [Catellatospora sp. KI3]|uniref:malectin domain-containing carbohydrate-binding protein n=1 Tax=Catellatospora sp. KI3 TaxID=3041620 RepID=UPI002482A0F6|nr:malectin domain-containing carbohydrate-binding protein [Catellatospora sp. KI3]MDI1465128.1 malectin domain-containing carbohydrate-binding protein [Catellatospora sp. KI3]
MRRLTRTSVAGLSALAITLLGIGPAQAVQPVYTSLPTAVPSTATPNINDGLVNSIVKVGNKVIVGGTFTGVTNQGASGTSYAQARLFSFDAATGLVDPAFAPVINDEVMQVMPGPVANTVLVAGRFTAVNNTTGGGYAKLVLLNTSDGSLVTTFKAPAFNGAVNTVKQFGNRLLVGGFFTTVTTNGTVVTRNGLATVDATTGAFDPYMNIPLVGHHNYNGTGTSSSVGATDLDITPDGTRAVVIGNFKTANGGDYDQVVQINLGAAAPTIAWWHTNRFDDVCKRTAFDKWVRDVDFSPDGSYFVVVTTGSPFGVTSLCDSASRWETYPNASFLQPTWVDWTGGDTLLSVAVTGTSVYVGGHQRWLNNSDGTDKAAQGAVARPGLAALEPASGLPQAWNPGRHPRGYGATALYASDTGLYVGSDTEWIGPFEYERKRIAYFPLAGGYTPQADTVGDLPTDVFFPNNTVSIPANEVLYRVNAGGPEVAATDGGLPWTIDTAVSPSPYHNTGSTPNTVASNTITLDGSVAASTPLAVFNDQRYDAAAAPEMSWSFPVATGTQVEVRLSFVARDWAYHDPGARVFDISIDGVLKADDYDTVAQVGYKVGHTLTFPVTSDGTVNIDFGHVALNPGIEAIEIVRTSGGTGSGVAKRSYDGTTAGALTPVGGADGTVWANVRGAFLVGNKLFYGMSNGTMYVRSFDGTTFGPAAVLNPHSDPRWDSIHVDEKDATSVTYAGVKTALYTELPNVRSMFYSGGKLFYTIAGQNKLFWRWFSPDSGIAGSQRFEIAGSGTATSLEYLADTSGVLFLSGGNLYWSRGGTDGRLIKRAFNGTAFSGTAVAVSGPSLGGVDWRSPGAFIRG